MRGLIQQSTRSVVSSTLLLLLSTLLIAGTSPAWSEETQRIENLTIALWPEYDRPAVLVTYRVKLPAEVTLPTQISLPVPTHVGPPTAIAKRGPDGNLYTAASTRNVDGDWATVTVETDSLAVQLEYYAPILSAGEVRNFIFRWPGGLEVGQLNYEVLQPKYATNLAIMPSPTSEEITSFGVMVQRAELGSLSATKEATIALTYSNPGARLTVTPAPVPEVTSALVRPSPPDRPTPPTTDSAYEISATQITLIVLGVAAAFIVGLWMGRNKGSDLSD